MTGSAPLPLDITADRWGGRWSRDGAALVFSDGGRTASIALYPATISRLASQLQSAVDDHERQQGTLWSENSRAAGLLTESRLRWRANTSATACGDRTYALLKNLPLVGFERSFKLQPGELLSHRFLLGARTASLAMEDVDFIARAMEAPDDLRRDILARLPESTFLHFGFESSPRQDTLKIYLEFPRAEAGAALGSPPLYLGFKWAADDSSRQAVSTYSQPVAWTADTLPDRIASAYGHSHPLAADAARQVTGLAMQRVAAAAMPLVVVTDTDSRRTSFDINLYAAGLRVAQVLPLLQALHRHFGIAEAGMDAMSSRFADDVVGHLSGGTDRRGHAFLTVYHTLAQP